MPRIVSGVQLDKSVPLPKIQPHGKWLRVLCAMTVSKPGEVGESFVCKNRKEANILYACARAKMMLIKTAKQSDGKVRIWRIK